MHILQSIATRDRIQNCFFFALVAYLTTLFRFVVDKSLSIFRDDVNRTTDREENSLCIWTYVSG